MLPTIQNRSLRTKNTQAAVAFLALTFAGKEFSASGAETITVDPTKVTPTVSIVGYLTAQKKPSDLPSRKNLYYNFFPGESYSGTAPQNTKLLATLVANDQACKTALNGCEANLKKIPDPAPAPNTRAVSHFVRCPSYVLAENFGVYGSYVYNVDITIGENKIVDSQVQVALNSAASNLGKLGFSGNVEIVVDGQVIQKFLLQEAWFSVLRPAGDSSIFMYGAKGTVVNVPPNKAVTARFKIMPTVATGEGVVPLWSCSTDLKLQ